MPTWAGSSGTKVHWVSLIFFDTPLPLGPVVSVPPLKVNRPAQVVLGLVPGLRVIRLPQKPPFQSLVMASTPSTVAVGSSQRRH